MKSNTAIRASVWVSQRRAQSLPEGRLIYDLASAE
jgi:hypothetical protein